MSYHVPKKFLDEFTLSGRSEHHLADFMGNAVHASLCKPLGELVRNAAAEGFDLAVASAFRSFDRQCRIWNDKAAGRRPVLADDESILDTTQLTPEELLFAILRWSALPGASRHHWGTDVDVYDRKGTQNGYQLRLTFDETIGSGPFAALHAWLDEYLLYKETDFFRPYTRPWGGVAPEPWHLSYAPLAVEFQQALEPSVLRALIASADLALKAEILIHFDAIYERFVWVPWSLYPQIWRPSQC